MSSSITVVKLTFQLRAKFCILSNNLWLHKIEVQHKRVCSWEIKSLMVLGDKSAKTNVLSMWEGHHAVFSLSITATAVSHRSLWGCVCGKGSVWQAFGWIHVYWRKHLLALPVGRCYMIKNWIVPKIWCDVLPGKDLNIRDGIEVLEQVVSLHVRSSKCRL